MSAQKFEFVRFFEDAYDVAVFNRTSDGGRLFEYSIGEWVWHRTREGEWERGEIENCKVYKGIQYYLIEGRYVTANDITR